MDATRERLVGTLRRELLDRMLLLGEAHLHAVLAEYQVHYNTAGRTRASPNTSPTTDAIAATDLDSEQIRRKSVLYGLINEYTRAA